MTKKKILVMTDHMPWGHRSIAKAIYSFLKTQDKEANFEVNYTEVKMPFAVADNLYTFLYRFFPAGNRISNQLMKSETSRKLFVEVSQFDLPELKKQVSRYKPDLIISCYFFHSQVLAKWREEEGLKFKLWTVVADPWTINPISFVGKADLNLVYDEIGEKMGMELGIEKSKILKTGWWVRREMYENIDREKARKRLGFNDSRKLVFIGGGSLGTYSLMRMLPVLLLIKKPIGVIFNTGTDKLAYQTVNEYQRLFKKMRKGDLVQIKNLGWIDNMAEVLTACDMVFGKAGPNFLFDVVARKKPLVAITHIGGQEDGNIELIKKKKLGWVKEKRNSAAKFLLNYINSPEEYENIYAKTIEDEAEKNKESMKILWKKLKKDLF